MILTDKAVFRFDSETRLAVLSSVHPDVEIDDVITCTGYTHDYAPQTVAVTPAPTLEELRLLRQEVDPHGAMLPRASG